MWGRALCNVQNSEAEDNLGGGRSGVTCMFLVVTILCSFPSSIKRQEYYIVYTKFVSTQLKGNVLTLSLRQVVIEQ